MTGERPTEPTDPFEGDADYWRRTNLSDEARAAMDDPRLKMGVLQAGIRNASSGSLPLAGVEAPDDAVAAAAANAETVDLPPFSPSAYPGGEAGVPDRPVLADVADVQLPPSHPQPE